MTTSVATDDGGDVGLTVLSFMGYGYSTHVGYARHTVVSHWERGAVDLTALSSPPAPWVVITTTCGATGGSMVVKLATLLFSVLHMPTLLLTYLVLTSLYFEMVCVNETDDRLMDRVLQNVKICASAYSCVFMGIYVYVHVSVRVNVYLNVSVCVAHCGLAMKDFAAMPSLVARWVVKTTAPVPSVTIGTSCLQSSVLCELRTFYSCHSAQVTLTHRGRDKMTATS